MLLIYAEQLLYSGSPRSKKIYIRCLFLNSIVQSTWQFEKWSLLQELFTLCVHIRFIRVTVARINFSDGKSIRVFLFDEWCDWRFLYPGFSWPAVDM